MQVKIFKRNSLVTTVTLVLVVLLPKKPLIRVLNPKNLTATLLVSNMMSYVLLINKHPIYVIPIDPSENSSG